MESQMPILCVIFLTIALTDAEVKFSIEKELIYQDLIVNNLHFAEGAELFEYLKAHNIPFCIATSSDFSECRVLLFMKCIWTLV